MKKIFVLLMSLMCLNIYGQQTKLIGSFENNQFILKLDATQLATVHDTKINGILNTGSTFIRAEIDDSSPSDINEKPYLLIKFQTSTSNVTLGIKLSKKVTEGLTTYELTELDTQKQDSEVAEIDDDPAGWECTTPKDCNGCIPKRAKGKVYGCKCPGEELWCVFKVTGKQNGEIPWGAIAAIVAAIIGQIK